MKQFVLDCSVSMSWCFEDEVNPFAENILESFRTHTAVVPSVWPLEVANVLIMAERKKRITEASATRFLNMLNALPISIDSETSAKAFNSILLLARLHHLSTYDAAYLELAMREGIPFATRDNELLHAARKAGVKLLSDQK